MNSLIFLGYCSHYILKAKPNFHCLSLNSADIYKALALRPFTNAPFPFFQHFQSLNSHHNPFLHILKIWLPLKVTSDPVSTKFYPSFGPLLYSSEEIACSSYFSHRDGRHSRFYFKSKNLLYICFLEE